MNLNQPKIIPFLTFNGNAKNAIVFYLDVFKHSSLNSIAYVSAGDRGVEGSVLNASVTLEGTTFIMMDIEPEYYVEPTWSTSFFLEIEDEDSFDDLFDKLSNGGTVLMGPEPINTSSISLKKCAWITDKYKFTWQIVVN